MDAAPNLPVGMSLRLYPTYCVQYMEFERGGSCRSQAQIEAQKHLRSNKPRPEVSGKASKRIRNAVNWLTSAARFQRVYSRIDNRHYGFKINFITLTLPSLDHGLTDHQFKNRLLKNWIERMKYRHGFRNYVWKVETQANGNIHAHITSDCFIHWSEIRSVWNDLLIKAGLMKSFADKHGHSDPNSTDVRAVKSIKDIAAYLAKYFSKSSNESVDSSTGEVEQRRSISGKLWACSHSLSERNPCSIHLDPQDQHNVSTSLVGSSAQAVPVLSEPDKFGHRRHLATVFFMEQKTWLELQNSLIGDHYFSRLSEIRTGVPPAPSLIKSTYANKHVTFNYRPEPRANQRTARLSEVRNRTHSSAAVYTPPVRTFAYQLSVFKEFGETRVQLN